MTGKPSLTIEEILTRYEEWDTFRRHVAHIPHPTKMGFIEGFDGPHEPAGLGKSKQTLYNNIEPNRNLPWPLLPEDESDLVWVLFGQYPFDLTWVRQSVVAALGRPLDRIVGQASNELLRHGVPMDEHAVDTMRRLKHDPTFKVACVDNIWVDVADGRCQLTNMQVRYTGSTTDRFYVCAHPLGAPYVPDHGDVFNVQQDLFLEMKPIRQPPSVAEALAAVKGRGIGELVDTVMMLNAHPELMDEYLNQTLPKYEFHLPRESKT